MSRAINNARGFPVPALFVDRLSRVQSRARARRRIHKSSRPATCCLPSRLLFYRHNHTLEDLSQHNNSSTTQQWPVLSKPPASPLVVSLLFPSCLRREDLCSLTGLRSGKAPRKQLAAKSSARKTAAAVSHSSSSTRRVSLTSSIIIDRHWWCQEASPFPPWNGRSP